MLPIFLQICSQEEKGGRHFRKLGFADVNLSEYAGAGPATQRYILQPYDRSHRLDNSIVRITVNVTLREGDTIFRRPVTRQQPIAIVAGEEEAANAAATVIGEGGEGNPPGSSGPPSLVPPQPGLPPSVASAQQSRLSGSKNSQMIKDRGETFFLFCRSDQQNTPEAESHSRNSSSSTGYASSTQQQQQQQLAKAASGASAAGAGEAAPGQQGHSRKSSAETTSSHNRYERK